MALTVASWYLTMGGSLPGGEVWQCGLHAAVLPGGATQQHADEVAADLPTKTKTVWNTSSFAIARVNGWSLRQWRVYYYPAGANKATIVSAGSSAPLNGAQTQSMPNQTAIVASLRSANPSRTGRSRIYIPALSGALENGQFATAVTTDIANGAAALCEALDSIAWVGPVLCGTSGSPVTSVQVDSVLDTQRRRRNKLVPTSVGIKSVTTA